jgi:hypothetical protein
VILYFYFLIAILVVVALLYELCKVCLIHYTITINTNPSHVGKVHNTQTWSLLVTLLQRTNWLAILTP